MSIAVTLAPKSDVAGGDVLHEEGDAAGELIGVRRAGAALDRDLLLADGHAVDQAVARVGRRRRRRAAPKRRALRKTCSSRVAGASTSIAGRSACGPASPARRSHRAAAPCRPPSASGERERERSDETSAPRRRH